MQQTLRPYASAGVILASAGLIAITPTAGPALDIQTRAVQLTSTDQPDPITTWADLITNTQTNLSALQAEFSQDPTPILDQIEANQSVYAQDLATAAQNAQNDLQTAIQGFPDVIQQSTSDLNSGDIYDALQGPYQYLLGSALEVNHDLANGGFQVAQAIADNVSNVLNDSGGLQPYLAFNDSVPLWFSELVTAPLYGPNAAMAGLDGVTADVVAAADNGDWTTVLSDLSNAPATVVDAYLNGYDAPNLVADVSTDALRRIIGLNPEAALLTGAERAREELDAAAFAVGQGTFHNIHEAALRIATDLGAGRELADVAGAQSTASADLSSVLTDLTGLFEPGAATDAGSSLSTDLSSLLVSLF